MTHSRMRGMGQASCLPYPHMSSSASPVLESALGARKQKSEGFSPVWPAKCPSIFVMRSWVSSYVQKGQGPIEMTWLMKLFRQESPVPWLADSQEGKPDMRTPQGSPIEMTWLVKLFRQESPVPWLADSQEGKPDMRTPQGSPVLE